MDIVGYVSRQVLKTLLRVMLGAQTIIRIIFERNIKAKILIKLPFVILSKLF